jgi:protein translocase SecG subunit
MNTLTIIQVVIAIALVVVILLQNRSAGAGGVFGGAGGGGTSGADFSAKRGLEKLLFRATIGLALAFLVVALLNLAQ